MSEASPSPSKPLASATSREELLWRALDGLLANAEVAGVRANKLGPLAARRLREQRAEVPKLLEDDARLATMAWMAAMPLLARIRALCDGPLLLLKGPEVAALYPGRARAFMDIDLLCVDAEGAHAALLSNGFAEVDDPELFRDHHHLRPLQLPGVWLKVEIHTRPMWPNGLKQPPVDEIVAAAVPSATRVAGISAPDPAHHAVILASHAWVHEPLRALRDLTDVAAVRLRAEPGSPDAVACAWGVERIWRTTSGAADGLFGGGAQSSAVRLWGRHLPVVRERNVLGNHLQRWLHSFWELPLLPAFLSTAEALRQEVLPEPGEPWPDKVARVTHAIVHPRAPLSAHTEAWRDARGDHHPTHSRED